jgi:hypothetical protein
MPASASAIRAATTANREGTLRRRDSAEGRKRETSSFGTSAASRDEPAS